MSDRQRHRGPLRRFAADTSGAFLPEFSVTFFLFLFILFGLIDFGRMFYGFVMAEKAAQIAARFAAVRPPVCAGVPDTHVAATSSPPDYGTYCRDASAPCKVEGTQTCSGVAGNPTADEIWQRIGALLPAGSTTADLQYSYSFDPELGFLGGPYVPSVTVELTGLDFEFITPLGPLSQLLTGSANSLGNIGSTFTFPTISASMPGEDLAQGSDG